MLFEIKKLSSESQRVLVGWWMVLIWSSFLYMDIPFAWGAEKSAEVNSEVLPHRWAAIRLSNVNQGATLEVKLKLDGQTTVFLVSESQLKSFPRVVRPLFRTETRNRANFSVVAPKSGHYYLIVDNRKGLTKRKYSLSIKARLDLQEKPLQNRESFTGNDPLKLLNRVIQTAFVVDPLKFNLTTCDQDNTFIRGETIYLCREYLKKLKNRLKDNRKINEVVLFTLMRESGQVLLDRWNYPLNTNGQVKDEFATVLMIMFGHRQTMDFQVTYLNLQGPEEERRSRIISKWLDDPFFVKKWQPFLIPKMQTRYLRVLKKEEYAWTSRRLIDRELNRRK